MKLSLWGNRLTGPIPAELGDLSSLTELSLGGNRLTGPIPAELLGALSNHKEVSLYSNQLTGPIPAELGDLSSLTRAVSQPQPTDGADSRRVGGPLQPHCGCISTTTN